MHQNFYEKALFVKGDVAASVGGRVQRRRMPSSALCFYPHFRGAALSGGSMHYEMHLFRSTTKQVLPSSERSLLVEGGPSSQLAHSPFSGIRSAISAKEAVLIGAL
jgi:hypothetical protein